MELNFSISPFSEYSGLVSFKIDWFDLLGVQRTLKSRLQHHSSKASVLLPSSYGPALMFIHDYQKDYSLDYTDLCWQSDVFALNVTLKIALNRYFLRILEAGNLR